MALGDRKSTKALSLFWILLSVTIWTQSQCQQLACGFPGAPLNGSVSPAGGTAFTVNATVRYSCSPGFILFGEEKRVCRKNGTWSAEIPLCDSNVARDKYATQSGEYRKLKAGLAVDGDPTTCSSTTKTQSERWWQLSLGQTYQVTVVAITISVGVWQKLSVYVVSAEGDNRIVYNLCGSFDGTFEFNMIEIKCGNSTGGQLGEYVFIRDNRPGAFQLNLCEVEVFAYRDDRPCGEPEVPLHGTVKRINETASQYGCQAGFTIKGPSVFRCVDSLWESPPPSCVELYCQAPPPIRGSKFLPIYAEWFPSPNKSSYPFGTVLNYTCEMDYVTEMVGALVCSENADWIGTHPICLPTECGPPPIVPNATFRFLNESSPTKTDSLVQLLCHDGFYITEGNAISRCLRAGNWSSINATCRALVTENLIEENLQPALGVILFVLIIVVIILFAVLVVVYLRGSDHLKRSIPMLARSSTEGADCTQSSSGMQTAVIAPVNNKLSPNHDQQDLYDDVWPSDEALADDTVLYTDAVSSTEDLTYDGKTDRIYDHPEGGCIDEADGEADVDEDDHVYYSPLEGIVDDQAEVTAMSAITSDRSKLPPADGAPESTPIKSELTINDQGNNLNFEDSEHIYEPLRKSPGSSFPLKPVYAQVDMALKKQKHHPDNSNYGVDTDKAEDDGSRPQPEGIIAYSTPSFTNGGYASSNRSNSTGPSTPTSPTTSIVTSLQRPLPPIPPTVGVTGDSASLASSVMIDNSLYEQRNSWIDYNDGTIIIGHPTSGSTC